MSFLPAAARATPLLNTIARSHTGGALQFYRCIRRSTYPPPRGQQNPRNKEAAKSSLGPWAQRERKESAPPKPAGKPERRGGPPDRDSRRSTSKFEKPERRGVKSGGREARGSAGRDSDRRAPSRERSFERDPRKRSFDREEPFKSRSFEKRDRDSRYSDREEPFKNRSFDKRDRDSRYTDREEASKSRSFEKRDRDSRYSDREDFSKNISFEKRDRYSDRDTSSKSRNVDRRDRDRDSRPSESRSTRGSVWDESASREPFSKNDELFNGNSGSRKYTPLPTAEDSPFSYGEDQQPERQWGPRREIARTDPDSEFIYGTSVVEAALKSGRRDLYKLYVYAGANRQPDSLVRDAAMKRLAKSARVHIVDEYDIGLLDSMANSRPHNGYVLECSSLYKTPILSLLPVTQPGSAITLQIAQHDNTQPDLQLNTLPPSIPCPDTDRYPLILMLDSILDPGNLGAILRSAYYLGASAVMFSATHSAPLSPVCLKASAGAAEFLPILAYKNPVRLIENSIANGWQFYAAVAPTPVTGGGPGKEPKREKSARLESMEVKQALQQKPTVVVMGAEGQGLSSPVRRACDKAVTITQVRGQEMGLDSLNVSVAAAVLCQGFLARHFGKNLGTGDRLF